MHCELRAEQMSETIRRNSEMVYRLAFSMVKSVQDAEDIHQEVFIQYILKNPLFENREHEKAWFIRVTANRCKNLWKTAWRRKMVSMEERGQAVAGPESGDETVDKNRFSCVKTGITSQELSEEEENVIETVKRLPMKYRVVVHLFYYEEMSHEEIAAVLKLKPSNVRTRLTRARKMLKEWLKEDI